MKQNCSIAFDWSMLSMIKTFDKSHKTTERIQIDCSSENNQHSTGKFWLTNRFMFRRSFEIWIIRLHGSWTIELPDRSSAFVYTLYDVFPNPVEI